MINETLDLLASCTSLAFQQACARLLPDLTGSESVCA
jgi:hypothetical protein